MRKPPGVVESSGNRAANRPTERTPVEPWEASHHSEDRIERRILVVRGHKVMLDADLAELYEVETGALNRAVQRNRDRFPADFMFQLTAKETEAALRCQSGISNVGPPADTPKRGGRRYLPNVFTEQGVACSPRCFAASGRSR